MSGRGGVTGVGGFLILGSIGRETLGVVGVDKLLSKVGEWELVDGGVG